MATGRGRQRDGDAIRIFWEESERRRLFWSDVKAFGLTEEVHRKPGDLSAEEESGTPCVAVECVDVWKNTRGEGGCLVCN